MDINMTKTKINSTIQEKIHKHIMHHACIYYHKHHHRVHRAVHHIHHFGVHLGELILIMTVWFSSLMFAGGIWLPENDSLVYPLQKVSKLECRTEYREDMDESCKIDLPIIRNAAYDQYKDELLYRQIYTVLFGGSYSTGWDVMAGGHQAVDIASARGTPLYSIGDGEIVFAWEQKGFGNMVRIKYLFQGQYIYALYVHMDTIEVYAGDFIKKWDRIGTVGNSGIVISGWLWWYHLHFQIDKSVNGRRARAYQWCLDLPKWHYNIIQNWLCRKEMMTYQYDPIILIEKNSLDAALLPAISADNIEQGETTAESEVIDNKPTTTPEEDTAEQTKPENTENTGSEQSEVLPAQIKNTIEVNIDRNILSENMKYFIDNYKIEITKPDKNILKVWDKTTFIIKVTDNAGAKYSGIMPSSIDFISSNTNIISDYVSIKRITDGVFSISITGRKSGASVILIAVEWQTIAKLPITIQ